MKRFFLTSVVLSGLLLGAGLPQLYGFVTELRSRGYSLIPAPQKVELQDRDFELDNTWGIESTVGDTRIAVRRLRRGAAELHGLDFTGSGSGKVVLEA